MLKPCIDCGEPVEGTRCDECAEADKRIKPLHLVEKPGKIPKLSPRERGYDNNWRRLSERARRMQPWCSHCGATEDLQLDHKPEAWERKRQGKRIRLEDVQVLCGDCNRKAGAARGEHITRSDQ